MSSLKKDKQRQASRQAGSKRLIDRQINRETKNDKQDKKDGWLVGSILWMVASIGGWSY